MTNSKKSLRPTRQRAAIAAALDRAGAFRSAQELHDEMRAAGQRVGLTTVYRTLQALAAAGEIDMLRGEDGEAIFRRCGTEGHHHHLLCTSCGTSVEINSDEVETWASRTASRHGFTSVSHTAEVYGLCAACSD